MRNSARRRKDPIRVTCKDIALESRVELLAQRLPICHVQFNNIARFRRADVCPAPSEQTTFFAASSWPTNFSLYVAAKFNSRRRRREKRDNKSAKTTLTSCRMDLLAQVGRKWRPHERLKLTSGAQRKTPVAQLPKQGQLVMELHFLFGGRKDRRQGHCRRRPRCAQLAAPVSGQSSPLRWRY